ncbi:hypothetical protein EDD21DRAFT_103060 [Dissophora ornata]|nr:hypothetical protein EDD21DRAFT_103060 [Dissophora ornata]
MRIKGQVPMPRRFDSFEHVLSKYARASPDTTITCYYHNQARFLNGLLNGPGWSRLRHPTTAAASLTVCRKCLLFFSCSLLLSTLPHLLFFLLFCYSVLVPRTQRIPPRSLLLILPFHPRLTACPHSNIQTHPPSPRPASLFDPTLHLPFESDRSAVTTPSHPRMSCPGPR